MCRRWFRATSHSRRRELTCEPDVANLVDATVEKFGRLDILVDKAVRSRDGCQRAGGVPTHDAVRSTSDRGARQHRQRVKYSRNALACRIACLQHVQVRRGTDDRLHGTGAGLEGVRVNNVNPGVIVTPIYKGTGMSEVRKSTPKSLNITKKLCRWVTLAMRRKWRRRLLFWLPVLHHSAPANIFTSTADGKPPALADS